METDRNPSPPPEILEAEAALAPDRIGETVFSRHWVFQCLLNAIKVAEDEKTSENYAEECVVELDTKVEEELCTLWDMSANSDVAHFLQEFKACGMFLQMIGSTKSPRLTEILVGILGNMASFPDISQEMTQEETFLSAMMALLGSTDSPTLIQVVRMFSMCILNEDSRAAVISEIKTNSAFLTNIKFILGNSLNGDLLKGCFHLLYYALDKDSSLCNTCCEEDFLKSFSFAAHHMVSLGNIEVLDDYFYVLHLISHEAGKTQLFSSFIEDVERLFKTYLRSAYETEGVLPSKEKCENLSAALSVIALQAGEPTAFLEDEDLNLLKSLCHVVETYLFKEPCEETRNVDEPVSDQEALNVLYSFLTRILKVQDETEMQE